MQSRTEGYALAKLLNLQEAADTLGVTKKTLRAHINAGELLCINVGRGQKRYDLRIDPADLLEFIKHRKTRLYAVSQTEKHVCKTTTRAAQPVGFTERFSELHFERSKKN